MDSDQRQRAFSGRRMTGRATHDHRALLKRLPGARTWLWTVLVLLALLCALAPTPASPSGQRSAAAQSSPTITLNPTQGPAGTVVDISAVGFPSGDNDHNATISFDGTPISPSPVFKPCGVGAVALPVGFGTACGGTAVKLTIPSTAASGDHTITVADPQGVTGQATFTIPQQATATPTNTPVPATGTPTNTPAAATPTATGTPAPTGTATNTPLPATGTPVPATSTPVPKPTATSTPKPAFPLVVLTYPLHLFQGGALALSLHAAPGSKVDVTLEFVANPPPHAGHGVPHAGTVLYKRLLHGATNSRGLFWLTLHIPYRPKVRARATLVVTTRQGSATYTARRTFA